MVCGDKKGSKVQSVGTPKHDSEATFDKIDTNVHPRLHTYATCNLSPIIWTTNTQTQPSVNFL